MFLTFTPFLCFSSMNWIIIWVCLEINTITFAFLLRHINKDIKSIECGLKYFIVQSSASACLLFCVISYSEKTRKMKTIISTILLLKLGIVPIHAWFPSIGSKIRWVTLTVLITWQKAIPIYLMIFSMKILVIARASVSILIGTVLQYKNRNRKKLIVYSRISNSCWILLASILNIQLIIIFCSIYFSSVIISIKIIIEKVPKRKKGFIKERNEIIVRFMIILILAGMPPSLGFFPKWMLLKEFVLNNISFIPLTLLFFTTVNFYVYLRLFVKTLSKKENRNIMLTELNTIIKFLVIFVRAFGLIILAVFCLAWKRIILIE